jgi:hypothetical protein
VQRGVGPSWPDTKIFALNNNTVEDKDVWSNSAYILEFTHNNLLLKTGYMMSLRYALLVFRSIRVNPGDFSKVSI